MHVIGTAGHVDHGKSALIEALTGTNPDRWPEERLRGMTLDLGFASLVFDDGVEAGIVDVPGHERFLHNMLAGAAGMELLLLVVDANEGVRPQTVEHLEILQFLNVRRAIVAVSKIDLVEPELRANACARIAGQLRGTIAEDAPLFAVSALTSENLEALRAALHDELAAMPPRNADAPAYLPIDRAFVLPGLGTVVTGTLMQGSIEAGETLALEPGGKPAHVRSIGVFATTRSRVEAGARVALSLPGVERGHVSRGQAIVGREFSAARSFTVRFVPLASARPLVRRRTPVRAYVGSAEILGTLVVDEASVHDDAMRAELHLREPVVAFPGVRFVVRRPSPMTLLGGGWIEGPTAQPLEERADAGEETILNVLGNAGLRALEPGEIAGAANLRESATRAALDRLVERAAVVRIARPEAYVDRDSAEATRRAIAAQLDEAHGREPWAMGVTSLALARTLGVAEPLLLRLAERFVEEGRIVQRDGYYASLAHRPGPTPEQAAFFERLVPIDAAQPLLPASFEAAAAAVKTGRVAGLVKAFDTMLAQGRLVRVGGDLYRDSQIASVRGSVEEFLRRRERMTAAEFRDLLGTTRKYAVPLLEWLDARGVTLRSGDYRTLRKRRAHDE